MTTHTTAQRNEAETSGPRRGTNPLDRGAVAQEHSVAVIVAGPPGSARTFLLDGTRMIAQLTAGLQAGTRPSKAGAPSTTL